MGYYIKDNISCSIASWFLQHIRKHKKALYRANYPEQGFVLCLYLGYYADEKDSNGTLLIHHTLFYPNFYNQFYPPAFSPSILFFFPIAPTSSHLHALS